MSTVVSWVVGHGLLGTAMRGSLARSTETWSPEGRFSWGRPEALHREFFESCEAFTRIVGDRSWQVAWCAGAGVVGAQPADLAAEAAALEALLFTLEQHGPSPPGALFLASSAGGVYAGSTGAPFDERTMAAPISPYGNEKLEQEQLAATWAARAGVSLVIGRIANLYGPGQNLAKAQGLISQIARALLRREPINIYVPLDTQRDYIYSADCGALGAEALHRLRCDAEARGEPVSVTKVLASQQAVTIGALLAEFRRLLKRPPRVALAVSPLSRFQVRDLRLRSVVWPELDRRQLTTLPAGISSVLRDLSRQLGRGRLV
jgi:UDP-glucose 4-epimerase